ncbi:MAG: Ig-like domain-containing protein, partial [Verrucomicrobiota bacterium]
IAVTDGEASVTNSVLLTVTEVNQAPVPVPLGTRRVNEGNLLTFTVGGTDGDLPPQRLTHTLVTGPQGLTVSSNGVVTWRPTEAQGPSTNLVLVRVTDDGQPALSATNAIEVLVREVNAPPVVVPAGLRRVSEGNPISFTVGATDTDLPAQRLTYALILGPVGLTVSSNGVVNWRPSEAQGPSTNTVLVRVTDDGAPALSATNAVEIVVREVNVAPVLDAVTDRVVKLPGSVGLVLKASDADLPIQPLTYRLVSGPAGMTVGVEGSLRWTPTEAQARSTNQVTVSVSDGVVNTTTAFKVVVEASPRLSLQVTGGASVAIQVAGPSGALCRLEQADSPFGPWTAVSGVADIATQGFGTPLAVIVPGPLQAGRLYRLRVL